MKQKEIQVQNIEETLIILKPIKQMPPLCEICQQQPREQLHHKDKNHKNNKEDNLQHLCTLCHAKVHGIEPRYSELRYLITLYRKCQQVRVALENQIRGFGRIGLETPEFFEKVIKEIKKEEKDYAKKIKKYLDNIEENEENQRKCDTLAPFETSFSPAYKYLTSIRGISYLTAGKLIALIDMKKSPTVSALWKYAGQAPECTRKKGKNSNWNHELKMVCYQISDSFVKHRTPKYREIYDVEKKRQLLLLEEEKNHCIYVKPKGNCSSPSSKMHAELRARRKAVKEFLKDYWIWSKKNIVTNHQKEVNEKCQIKEIES